MTHCAYCGRKLRSDDSPCPGCEQFSIDLQAADDVGDERRMVPIARFTNAAEAGYFAHELERNEGINTSMFADDSFDALSGYWSTRYVLNVPAAMSDAARASLQAMIASGGNNGLQDSDDDAKTADMFEEQELQNFGTAEDQDRRALAFETWLDADSTEYQDTCVEDSGVNWVPIILTLAAGSGVFWMVQGMQERPNPAVMAAPAGNQHEDLWHCLNRDSGRWVQHLDDDRGVRELTTDPRRNLVVIREDVDGDGVYEKEAAFHR